MQIMEATEQLKQEGWTYTLQVHSFRREAERDRETERERQRETKREREKKRERESLTTATITATYS